MTGDVPRSLRELWQRSGPVKRRRLLTILGSTVLAALVALAVVAVVIALLL